MTTITSLKDPQEIMTHFNLCFSFLNKVTQTQCKTDLRILHESEKINKRNNRSFYCAFCYSFCWSYLINVTRLSDHKTFKYFLRMNPSKVAQPAKIKKRLNKAIPMQNKSITILNKSGRWKCEKVLSDQAISNKPSNSIQKSKPLCQ